MNILEEFYKDCAFYNFEVVAIASGLAFIRDRYGDVIITLPRSNRCMLDLFQAVRARSMRGRWGAAKMPLKQLADPSTLMTWEEYDAKYEGLYKRDPTETARANVS